MSCNRPHAELLSPRERDALDAIIEHYRATGASPSHRDLQRALGLGYDGYVRHLVGKLRDKGFIEASHRERRAIRVLFTPEGEAFDSNGERMRALEERVLALQSQLFAVCAIRRCVAPHPIPVCEPCSSACTTPALRRCPRRRR